MLSPKNLEVKAVHHSSYNQQAFPMSNIIVITKRKRTLKKPSMQSENAAQPLQLDMLADH